MIFYLGFGALALLAKIVYHLQIINEAGYLRE
jgi:hypothetical protein